MDSKQKKNQERASSMAFLRKCFSRVEWEWLTDQEPFREAMKDVWTFNDAESLVSDGLALLTKAPLWIAQQHMATAA